MNGTIELFPGVQFRRGIPRPDTNCWEFWADNSLLLGAPLAPKSLPDTPDGRWLPARNAYADDVVLDHMARVHLDCQKLATAIADAGVDCGHIGAGHQLNGPQLLMVLGDMVTMLKEAAKDHQDAERYRSMRNCEWPGGCQQVGIVSRDNDSVWLHGEEADRKVDAMMESHKTS